MIDLLSPIEQIVKETVNEVAARSGISMRFKTRRAFARGAEYRVPVRPVRPVARLAALYDVFAQAEEEIQTRYPGLRVLLEPDQEETAGSRGRVRKPVPKRKG